MRAFYNYLLNYKISFPNVLNDVKNLFNYYYLQELYENGKTRLISF